MSTMTKLELSFSVEQRYLINDAAARLYLHETEFAERVLLHEAQRVIAAHAEIVASLREEFLGLSAAESQFQPNAKLARAIKRVRYWHPNKQDRIDGHGRSDLQDSN